MSVKRPEGMSSKEYQAWYMKQKAECPCGTVTARCNMSHHKKTLKHQKWEGEQDSELKMKKMKEENKKLKEYIKKLGEKIV